MALITPAGCPRPWTSYGSIIGGIGGYSGGAAGGIGGAAVVLAAYVNMNNTGYIAGGDGGPGLNGVPGALAGPA